MNLQTVLILISGVVNQFIDKEPAFIQSNVAPHIRDHFKEIGYEPTPGEFDTFVKVCTEAAIKEQKYRFGQLAAKAK